MDKKLLLKISGAEGEPREIVIRPGITTRDVLASAKLDQKFFLTADPAGEPFGRDEALWDKVSDGGKLFAVPAMSVGT